MKKVNAAGSGIARHGDMNRSEPARCRAILAIPILATLIVAPIGALAAPQSAPSGVSELRLDAALIESFIRVIYLGDDGRFHFREYSRCSYEFIQNPRVSVEGGLVRVSAEYWSRRGSEGLGGCVGGPGINTNVLLSARLAPEGSAIAIELLSVETDTLPALSAVILDLAGVRLPMTLDFDLMGAINDVLYDNQNFGVASLEVHDVLVEESSVLLRLTMQLGIW